LPGILPPASLIEPAPTESAAPPTWVTVPPQVFVKVVLAKVIAAGVMGKMSLNVAVVSVSALLFDKVILSVEVPPGLMLAGVKAFAISGLASTERVAEVGNALLPDGVTNPSVGIVLT
jgi:hypothetical protein